MREESDYQMNWQNLLPSAPWGKRAMPRGGLMDDYFYILSGRAGMFTVYSDTWRSPDGIYWEKMSENTGWGKRCYPEVELIDGNIILIGGQSLNQFYNDVWISSDCGKTWKQICANAPWNVRAGHHTITINNEIYLFGGARNTRDRIFYPELWVSKDLGETWQLRAELPNEMGRAGMQVVYINGVIYFMGGDHDAPVFLPNWQGRRNDIWQSTDLGKTWQLLGHAPWSPRTGQQCIAHNDKVICIGGHVQGKYKYKQLLAHDMWLWNPKDGLAGWKLISNNVWNAETNPRGSGKSDFMLEIRDNKLWTIGGDREVISPYPQDNDVWVTDLPAEIL